MECGWFFDSLKTILFYYLDSAGKNSITATCLHVFSKITGDTLGKIYLRSISSRQADTELIDFNVRAGNCSSFNQNHETELLPWNIIIS